MDFLFDFLASVLAFFYDVTSSYGGSIVLLTLAVMVVVTPLTLKSTRSMIAMQRLQPELRKLQAKYKDDRQKLNEEMMAFYKEHNINPLGGCLPLLVQMPVFFVLYRVLTGMSKLPAYGHDMGAAVGTYGRNPGGGGTYSGFGTFDPGYLDHSTPLFRVLNGAR
jgi:YidC/Oxa1 family membrane protein insertase